MNVEWTHKATQINDVRKVRNFYILDIDAVGQPIFVDENVFRSRVNAYYLREQGSEIKRDEVLNVKWNMVIYKGYFVKMNTLGEIQKYEKDDNKFYISYLEIDGPLGTYVPV